MARTKKTKASFDYDNIKFKDTLSFEDYVYIVKSVSDSVVNQLTTDDLTTKEIIFIISLVEMCTDINTEELSESEKWNLYTKTNIVNDIAEHIGTNIITLLYKDIDETVKYKLSFNKELKALSLSLIDYLTNTKSENETNAQNIGELKEVVNSLESMLNNGIS